MRRLVGVLAMTGLLACGGSTAPAPVTADTPPVPGAIKFAPSNGMYLWWHAAEVCSGLTGDIGTVTFYKAPHASIVVGGELYTAYWFKVGNRILVSEDRVGDDFVFRHEFTHALLQDGSHPAAYFLNGICGDLMFYGTALH